MNRKYRKRLFSKPPRMLMLFSCTMILLIVLISCETTTHSFDPTTVPEYLEIPASPELLRVEDTMTTEEQFKTATINISRLVGYVEKLKLVYIPGVFLYYKGILIVAAQ